MENTQNSVETEVKQTWEAPSIERIEVGEATEFGIPMGGDSTGWES